MVFRSKAFLRQTASISASGAFVKSTDTTNPGIHPVRG